MPANGQKPPLEISTTPATAGIATGLRYIIALALNTAANQGWIPAEQVGEVAGHIAAVLIGAYAVYKSVTRQQVTIIAADAAPNAAAKVTGGAKEVAEKLKS